MLANPVFQAHTTPSQEKFGFDDDHKDDYETPLSALEVAANEQPSIVPPINSFYMTVLTTNDKDEHAQGAKLGDMDYAELADEHHVYETLDSQEPPAAGHQPQLAAPKGQGKETSSGPDVQPRAAPSVVFKDYHNYEYDEASS